MLSCEKETKCIVLAYCVISNYHIKDEIVPCVNKNIFFSFICFQGEWILSGKDVCDNLQQLHLYMYVVKCVNIGSSKDPFLSRVSDFAVVFGNELDAEVYHVNLHLELTMLIFPSK